MMVNRYQSFVNTLLHEDGSLSGVVVTDNNGYKVRWGINQKSWPAVDVEHLTLEDAVRECYAKIWPAGLELVGSQMIASAVFDVEFNSGHTQGVRLLQRAVGTTDDGVIGPATAFAVTRDVRGARVLLRAMIEDHYRTIAVRNPADAQYLDGWLKRVDQNFSPLE